MTAGYPIEIGDLEFEPVPENWIDVGADQFEPDGPQLLAVSVALLRNSTLKIRYAHPEHNSVGAMFFPTLEDRTVPDDSAVEPWRRSVGASRLEPVGTIRAPEREHLLELWGDRVDEVLEEPERFSAKRPIADGGHSSDGTECNVCGGTEQDHHLVTDIEALHGGSVWVYDDGFARVVPDWTGQTLLAATEQGGGSE